MLASIGEKLSTTSNVPVVIVSLSLMLIGGFAIGLLEAIVSAVGLSIWKDGVVFAILIVVLLVKPTGILGRPQTEKV